MADRTENLAPPSEWKPGDVIVHRNGHAAVLKERKTPGNDPGSLWPGWWIVGGGGLADYVAAENWVRLTPTLGRIVHIAATSIKEAARG